MIRLHQSELLLYYAGQMQAPFKPPLWPTLPGDRSQTSLCSGMTPEIGKLPWVAPESAAALFATPAHSMAWNQDSL